MHEDARLPAIRLPIGIIAAGAINTSVADLANWMRSPGEERRRAGPWLCGHLGSDSEFEESVREHNERRRYLLSALVRRMAEGCHPRAKSLKELIDVLFALTSLAFFAQLMSGGRTTDAACRLIQALSADAVRRAGLGPN